MIIFFSYPFLTAHIELGSGLELNEADSRAKHVHTLNQHLMASVDQHMLRELNERVWGKGWKKKRKTMYPISI